MITELEGMMAERIALFAKKNKGVLPERVLVYRDGVSEVSLLLTYFPAQKS